ncbi:PREDICTED: cytochrome P450 9e2 [Dinoponera quadriceps]|uniref:Cytochrome P450 9e2 n=1 Tax=Dinoponera quadriceps TaxID=609295 RepID=A0A6P3XGV7_DINQU|nr:PREDICTED: cytochrome P450 9e2 [Dinoponera quadriceps]
MEYWTILLSVAIGALSIHYLFKHFNFFKRHGLIHAPSIPILGCMAPVLFRQTSFTEILQDVYNYNPDAKYLGFYGMTQPIIMLRDPELIKEILIKNFDSFPNRRGFVEINDPLSAKNLFSLRDQKWHDVRTLLSPAFTTSKLKAMFVLMSECAVDFTEFLSETSADKSEIDMKDAFTKFTTDVIATCAFGIKVDTMRNPTNRFFIYGKEITNFQGVRGIKFLTFKMFPKLAHFLGLKMISEKIVNFFKNIVETTIVSRDAENITRPDMIQLMMDMRGKRGAERELSIEDMTAQAFIFFFAGFDSSATVMSFAAHEIAINPDVQAKLWREIDEVLEESNGKVTYEAINRLKYLDAVLSETLRMYTAPFIERECERDYELPPTLPNEKPFTLKKGMLVWMPIYAIHRDGKYYDDPEKFRPERFLDNNVYHNSSCYIPFGLGPRICIANRFALLEIKVLLFHLLARCELRPCAKTTLKLSKSLAIMLEGGFWLNVKRRSDVHPMIDVGSTTPDDDVINS